MTPRGSHASRTSLGRRTLVVDNGAYTIKAGFVTETPHTDGDCTAIPNCLAKPSRNQILVGSDLDDWTDFAEMTFRRPVQKGNLVSWEAEKLIWDHEFFSKTAKLHVGPVAKNSGSCLLRTFPVRSFRDQHSVHGIFQLCLFSSIKL